MLIIKYAKLNQRSGQTRIFSFSKLQPELPALPVYLRAVKYFARDSQALRKSALPA